MGSASAIPNSKSNSQTLMDRLEYIIRFTSNFIHCICSLDCEITSLLVGNSLCASCDCLDEPVDIRGSLINQCMTIKLIVNEIRNIRTGCFIVSFLCLTVRMWNDLPDPVFPPSYSMFKIHVHSFFSSQRPYTQNSQS